MQLDIRILIAERIMEIKANCRKGFSMGKEVMIPQDMIHQIKEIMNIARHNVAREVNNEQLFAYWNIGRVIVEHEQNFNERAEYGKQTLKQLSGVLTQTARHCLAN